MREIKFQVIANNKIIGEERLNRTQWEWQYYILNPDKGVRWTSGVFGNSPDLIRRQFTGLLDKNGKEIYEGDIFEVAGNHRYIVKFFEESENSFEKAYACFCLTIPEKMTFPIDEYAMKNGKIIGNIYENKQLLK